MGKKIKRKKPLGNIPNKWIVVLKIAAACMLWLVASLFFFQYVDIFWVEVEYAPGTYDFSPWRNIDIFIVPLIGILLVLAYISFLINRIVDKRIHQADRFDLLYKTIFTVFLLYIAIRSIFIPPFEAPILILTLAVFAGVFNWIIPRLQYYDDTEEF